LYKLFGAYVGTAKSLAVAYGGHHFYTLSIFTVLIISI